jgi:hypothetical protein
LLLERYGVSVARLANVFDVVLAAQLKKTTATELNTPRNDIRVSTSAADEPDDSEGEQEEGPKRRKKTRDYSEESDGEESEDDSLSDQESEGTVCVRSWPHSSTEREKKAVALPGVMIHR